MERSGSVKNDKTQKCDRKGRGEGEVWGLKEPTVRNGNSNGSGWRIFPGRRAHLDELKLRHRCHCGLDFRLAAERERQHAKRPDSESNMDTVTGDWDGGEWRGTGQPSVPCGKPSI
eukprot:4003934-Pleurochrysis_carterae.AAC.5